MLTQTQWLESVGADKYQELAALHAKKMAKMREMVTGVILAKDKVNAFDKYAYFSEKGYKELFNRMAVSCGMELVPEEISREYYTGTGKAANGARVTWRFYLIDTDTGFSRSVTVTGEGLDKGDKAIYKAHTGAFKYFAANTFLIATGDDPEAESPTNVKTAKDKEEEYTKAMLACEELKREAEEIGLNIHEGKTAQYLIEKTSVKDNVPKDVIECEVYSKTLNYLINAYKQKANKGHAQV